MLILLEAPGPRAALDAGSGFVSADNNDQTATNMWNLLREVGIDRARDYVAWNVIPWYIGDGTKIRAARSSNMDEAREATRELLALLPEVRVVVLLGRQAAKAWAVLGLKMEAIEAPHPSPLSVNTDPQRRSEIRDALAKALARANG